MKRKYLEKQPLEPLFIVPGNHDVDIGGDARAEVISHRGYFSKWFYSIAEIGAQTGIYAGGSRGVAHCQLDAEKCLPQKTPG